MKIKLAKSELIHFVGIGGIGMSGLALIMKELGFKVRGSDILNNFNKWLYPNLIAQNIHIAVISRPGYLNSILNTSKVPNLGKKIKANQSRIIFHKKKPVWVFLKNKLLFISSSEIRKTKTYI